MSKITTLENFRPVREGLRTAGQTLVLTNGHFDLLHVGHVRYLQTAKALGDVLVVGLNDDASTRALKGPKRPIVPATERAELLAALEAVDYVIPFAELTAECLVTTLQPEIYVKGGNWNVKNLPEAPAVRAYGGQIRIIEVVLGRSTTNIIDTILERYDSTDVVSLESAPAEVQPDAGPGIARSAAIISAGNVASRVLGLIREQVIAYLFGAGPLVDAFVVASQVPTLIYDLLIGGLLSSALVPVFSDYAAPERRPELWRLASIIFSLVASVMAVFVLAIELGAPWVALAMGSGFSPDTLAATTRMIRIVVPALVFFGLSGASTGLLYTLKRFRYPAFGAAAFNATVITVGVLLARPVGIYSLAMGVLAGAGVQLAIQLPDLPRAHLRFEIDLSHPGLRRIGRLYLPIILGLVVSNIGVIIDRNLASRTGAGSIAWMRYATTLIQAPLGLVSVAISLAALPSLSQLHVTGDLDSFRQTLARGLRMILVLIIPATVGLFVLSEPIIRLLFEHGEFTAFDTLQTTRALRLYLFGLVGAAIDWPLIFAFYARKDTLTPALVGVVAVLIYLIVAPTLAFVVGMGFLGLVVANSVQLTSHAVIMLVLLHRRIDGVRGSRLVETVAKTGLAALAMGGAVWVFVSRLSSMIGVTGIAGQVLIAGSATIVGLATYGLLSALLSVEEVGIIWNTIRRKLIPTV